MAFDGRRVLSLESRRAVEMAELIRRQGGDPFVAPSMREVPLAADQATAQFAERLYAGGFDMMVLLTGVGTRQLNRLLGPRFVEALRLLTVAARGPKPVAALREMGLEVAVTPAEYVAESLVEALGDRVRGQRVLLARAAVARDVIPDALRARGAMVDVVDAYRTVIPAESVTAIRTLFGPGGRAPDAATFTSSSTVTNFLNLLREAGVARPGSMRAVSIGPITSRTLRENRWEPAGEADPHDLGGLVEVVVRAMG